MRQLGREAACVWHGHAHTVEWLLTESMAEQAPSMAEQVREADRDNTPHYATPKHDEARRSRVAGRESPRAATSHARSAAPQRSSS